MAVDLRIEKFAVDTFAKVWFYTNYEESLLPRPKDYGDEDETDCTLETLGLIFARLFLYGEHLRLNLESEYDIYSDNGVDFYHYICKHMAKYIPYLEMNVFDKMLMSCAVVSMMGLMCGSHKNVIYRYTGPLAWAMYFEKASKKEFYLAGGWTELQNYAESCFTKILDNNYLKQISFDIRSDLERAKHVFKFGEQFYDWSYLIEVYKRRMFGMYECAVCLNCLPLFVVFYSISYGGDAAVGELQLVEGYMQLFLRSLTFAKFEEVSRFVMEENSSHTTTEKGKEIAANSVKSACTQLLYERVFPREKWAECEDLNEYEMQRRCIFCGDHTETIASPTPSDDSVKVECFKSMIQCTVSDVETADSSQSEPTSYGKTSDEIEEEIVLRLFLALGIEPILSIVKADIEAEFGCQNKLQNITPKKPKKKKKKKSVQSKEID